MNTIRKIIISALLILTAIGLTTSLPAFADGKTDAEAACPGCHGVIINGIQAVGIGGRNCAQRTTAEWTATIERMNNKGCAVPAGSIAGIASYLAGLGGTISTPTTCYDTGGWTYITYTGTCPPGFSTTPPTSTSTTTTIPTVTTTTSTSLFAGTTCYYASGESFVAHIGLTPYCPFGTAYTPPPSCPGGTLSIVIDHVWQCSIQCPDGSTVTALWGAVPTCPSTTSTTSTSTTSIATTTTTTLCNTYVNGTTQHPYSGSGSCHSFAIDDMSGAHIVRDQSYCKKHMSHLNSKGNHVHAYPHPVCM